MASDRVTGRVRGTGFTGRVTGRAPGTAPGSAALAGTNPLGGLDVAAWQEGHTGLRFDLVGEDLTAYAIDPEGVARYLERLQQAHYSSATPQELAQRSLAIEEEAYHLMAGIDADLVLLAGAVGRDSRYYWDANATAWHDTYLETVGVQGEAFAAGAAASCNWGAIARRTAFADLVGGVAGGITGELYRVFLNATRAAGVMGIIGGAVSVSLINGAMHWYDTCYISEMPAPGLTSPGA